MQGTNENMHKYAQNMYKYVLQNAANMYDLLQLRFAMIVQRRRQYWKFIFILRRYYDAPLHRIELVISFFCFSSDLTAAENK